MEEEYQNSGEPGIEILDLAKDYIKFTLYNADLSIANSLRRIMLSEVPTMAVEFVQFNTNTSSLHDEYIAHRLGLVPLYSSNVDNFNYPHECGCANGCALCTVKFTLKVKNDGSHVNLEDGREPDESDYILDVTTKDLVQEDFETEDQRSVKPVEYQSISGENKGVLLLKLQKGQEIDLVCFAKKGQGKVHSKWQPAAVANFTYNPVIEINQMKMSSLSTAQKIEFVNSCPRKTFGFNSKTTQVYVEDARKYDFSGECLEVAKNFGIPDLVKIGTSPDKFTFYVESNGALKPDEIVDSALYQLNFKLETIDDALKNIRMVYSK